MNISLWSVAGVGALLLATAGGLAPAAAQSLPGDPIDGIASPRVVTVDMVDFAFEPARVVVRRGDVVRFVQRSSTPHNVEFRETPRETELLEEFKPEVSRIGTRAVDFPPARMGPFLISEGEIYEFRVGSNFAPGEHGIVCTPHESVGMTGTIVVEESRVLSDAEAGD